MTSEEQRAEAARQRLAEVLGEYQALFGAAAAGQLRNDVSKLLMQPSAPTRPARPGAPVPPERDASREPVFEQFPGIVTASPAMKKVLELLLKVAPTDATVLIHGESGTGKELIARAIHDKSRRARGPYVAENCAALPENLLESELFGHTRGAFTGADRNRKGRFSTADGGTLFLDEVGDMSPGLQKKLLRSLQEGEIRPVGSSQSIKVDVRTLSASNKDLAQLVEQGRFREDLYYRLSPIRIDLPPLRERGQDVVLLARTLLQQAAEHLQRPVPEFTAAALETMLAYAWPGNVRQLQNEIQRALALADPDKAIDVADLSPEIRG